MTVVALLARAQLEAMRRAQRLVFTGANDELRELVELCGLTDIVGLEPSSPDEPS